MRRPSNRYYMLVCSLPALPTHLDAEHPPISAERLAMRLRMLEPEDALEIERMRAVLDWGNQYSEPDDAAIVRRVRVLMERISNPLVREILEFGLDMRMIAVALRCRRREIDLPAVGFGRWFEQIRRHFKQPDFRLGQVVPGIAEAERLLVQRDSLMLYRRFVLGATWDYLRKLAEGYYFEFEAVVLYIARWDCIRRWQLLDPERGRAIFEALVTEALGEYANVYS